MKRSVLSVFIFIIIVFSKSLSAQVPEFLFNGGFEGNYLKGVARGWHDNSGWADVNLKYYEESKAAHRGKAQKIECLSFGSGAVQFVQPNVHIQAGRAYEIRIWMKGKIDSPVDILLRKQGKPYTAYASSGFKVTEDWREYCFTAAPEVDDPSAFFMISFRSTGVLWVDDAALTDISSRTSGAAPLKGNLLANGSFEVGLDRWGVLIREAGGYEYEMPVRILNMKPDIDDKWYKIGRHSLRVSIPIQGRFILTSPYVRLNTGRKYSLSLWLSSNPPRSVRISLASGYLGKQVSIDKTFKVGSQWTLCELSAVFGPAQEDAYYIRLESEGQGDIWIDGVQLQEGDVSAFIPRCPVEIGLKREDISTIYTVGDRIVLQSTLMSSKNMGSCSISIRSKDFFGNTTELLKKDIVLRENDRHEIKFEHPSDRSGYFKVVAEIRQNDKVVDSSEMAIGVLHRQNIELFNSSPFGNHVSFDPNSLKIAKQLGVSWLRMHPPLGTKWFVVEQKKGKFVFQDKPILLAKSMGFNILGSLDTTPRWASSAPSDMQRQDAGGYRAYPPKDMADWEKYVYETVLHYKGVIDCWEVWNEPDSGKFLKLSGMMSEFKKPDVYSELLRVAYKAAKRANPNAVIVGGCTAGQPSVKWFEKIFAHGAYDYMDVLSFHFYTDGRPGDSLDTPIGMHIMKLKELLRKYGKGIEKPIWETESGIKYTQSEYSNILQIIPGYPVPGEDAAVYLVRNYVHLLSSGVSKWFYYNMFNSHRIDRSEGTGFLEWDGSPRPLAIAYANLTWVIGNAKYNHALSLGDAVTGEEFTNENSVIDVIWAKGWSGQNTTQVSVQNPGTYARAEVYDMMGGKSRSEVNQNVIDVIASKTPVYVVFSN